MHRTEGANNLVNLFTDGPPGTTVEEDWLNAIQEEIAYVIEQAGLTLKSANTETRQQLKEALDNAYVSKEWSVLSRSKFTYNGGVTAYTVKVSGGIYIVKDKTAKWSSELTVAAIGTPGASTWYYLYLDYSAITVGTDITATQLIWSSTGPTYSHTYKGWYNGDDLCIFATRTNAAPTNILEFFHDGGDCAFFADYIEDATLLTPSTTWTDVTLSLPGFATKANIATWMDYIDANQYGWWRTNGQTGTVGHHGSFSGTADIGVMILDVLTDSTQKIEVKFSGASANDTISVYTNGWFFPVGM